MTSEPAQIATRPASGPLCTKPGSLRPANIAAIVPPAIAISEFTATRPEILSMSCADITLKPNQPTVSTHAPSARNGIDDGGCAAIAAARGIAAAARAEQQHGHEPDPAAHRVHDDAAREVVELRAERARHPRLDAEALVPRDAFEERIDERDEQERRRDLRIELRALGDAARHDRRNRRGERQQEEELDELVAVLLRERRRVGEERDAVGDRVADEEVRDRRDGEVDQDLAQAR